MNSEKFEIKIDFRDFYPGLKDEMDAFETLLRRELPKNTLTDEIEKKMESRFCHCCFFGRVVGRIMGEPLCEECAKELYGFEADEEGVTFKKKDPYNQMWYRKRKALPIFEAFLHAELRSWELEMKLEEKENKR